MNKFNINEDTITNMSDYRPGTVLQTQDSVPVVIKSIMATDEFGDESLIAITTDHRVMVVIESDAVVFDDPVEAAEYYWTKCNTDGYTLLCRLGWLTLSRAAIRRSVHKAIQKPTDSSAS